MSEEINESVPTEAVEQSPATVAEDGTIKLDMRQVQEPQEEVVEEAVSEEPVAEVQEVVAEEPIEEAPAPIQEPAEVLQEITEEEVEEVTEQLHEDVTEAIQESKEKGIDLPENIQKVVDFMNETGGDLEDYVKLNTDYASLDEDSLLKEYYQQANPLLDNEDINFLIEDKFSYDEDLDEERDIRRKKLDRKQELAKAKQHLDGLKSKYYDEIKMGSKLTSEQSKAVDFFNRYTKESEEAAKVTERQTSRFKSASDNVFSDSFQGFDYNVGDKKYRYKVNNASEVKETQGDINNFIKKFLNEKNEMSDAKGYHKSLFTAMNADSVAQHFYEQGKADAMKDSMAKTKNVDMNARGVHEKVTTSNGWQVRAVDSGGSSSKLKVKFKK
jgi:hypothetical protein